MIRFSSIARTSALLLALSLAGQPVMAGDASDRRADRGKEFAKFSQNRKSARRGEKRVERKTRRQEKRARYSKRIGDLMASKRHERVDVIVRYKDKPRRASRHEAEELGGEVASRCAR